MAFTPTPKRVTIRPEGAPRVTTIEIERACGHLDTIEVRGDPTRSTYVDNARLRDCADCYRAKQSEADTAAVEAGKRVALEGSERQVAWAQGIRQRRASEMADVITEITTVAKQLVAKKLVTADVVKDRLAGLRGVIGYLMAGGVEWEFLDEDGNERRSASNQARWWIDCRQLTPRDFVASLLPDQPWEGVPGWLALFEAPRATEAVEEQPEAAQAVPVLELDDEPF